MLQHETIPQPSPLVRQDISAGCASEAVSTSIEVDAGEQAQSVFDTAMTPQEFARAIALVEARREIRRKPKLDAPTTRTLLTDSAGNVFTVDASMEELKAEVQAHRAIKHQDVAMTARKRKELSWWLLLGGFLLSSAAVIGLTFLMYVCVGRYNSAMRAYIQQQQQIARMDVQMSNVMSSIRFPAMRSLTLASENQPVYARYEDIVALAQGSPASRILVASSLGATTSGAAQWTLFKAHGHYFVRGWRYTNRTSANGNVFAATASGENLQTMSEVPIERFKNRPFRPSFVQEYYGSGEEIQLPGSP